MPHQVQHLVDSGAVTALVHLLSGGGSRGGSDDDDEDDNEEDEDNDEDGHDEPDALIVCVALQALENILQIGKQWQETNGAAENPWATLVASHGLEHIESLQKHANQDVYQKAIRILDEHFPLEDSELGGSDDEASINDGIDVRELFGVWEDSFGGFVTIRRVGAEIEIMHSLLSRGLLLPENDFVREHTLHYLGSTGSKNDNVITWDNGSAWYPQD